MTVPLRIFWPRIDRTRRIAPYYSALQAATAARPDVEVTFQDRHWKSGDEEGGDAKSYPALDCEQVNAHDVLFTDSLFAFQDEQWDKIKIPKVLLITDQHEGTEYNRVAFERYGFTFFLCRYRDPTLSLSSWAVGRWAWLPLEIDPAVIRDWDEPKRHRAALLGSLRAEIYPRRQQVLDACQGHDWFYRRPRPANGSSRSPQGADYSRLLNGSILALTCPSIYQYVVLKYFEIPGSKCALMAPWLDELTDLGFVPYENMIPLEDLSGPALCAEIENWLGRPAELAAIATAGHRLIQERHTAVQRAGQLIEYLQCHCRNQSGIISTESF